MAKELMISADRPALALSQSNPFNTLQCIILFYGLNLDLDIHTCRQIETHQHVNRLRIRIDDIDQTIVGTNFEMLMRIFVNERRASYCKPFFLSWQGYWTNYLGSTSLCSVYDPFYGLVEHTMIVRFKSNANLLLAHKYTYSKILVTTPAPTVRPPSRMAKFCPCSRAIGTISSTSRFTSSPGMTISTPSGSAMFPVTSIVLM